MHDFILNIDMINILMTSFVIISLGAIFLLIKCARLLRQNDEDIEQLRNTCIMLNSDLSDSQRYAKKLNNIIKELNEEAYEVQKEWSIDNNFKETDKEV